MTSNSPTSNGGQVCLSDSRDQNAQLTLLYRIQTLLSIANEKEDNGRQTTEEVPRIQKGNTNKLYKNAPQREKRVIKQLPFVCRSPFLRDYKNILKDNLTHDEKIVVDYAILPFDLDCKKCK